MVPSIQHWRRNYRATVKNWFNVVFPRGTNATRKHRRRSGYSVRGRLLELVAAVQRHDPGCEVEVLDPLEAGVFHDLLEMLLVGVRAD